MAGMSELNANEVMMPPWEPERMVDEKEVRQRMGSPSERSW